MGGQQLKHAGRQQRQTSGRLEHVQLLCDVSIAHGVTENHHQGRVLPEQKVMMIWGFGRPDCQGHRRPLCSDRRWLYRHLKRKAPNCFVSLFQRDVRKISE